MMLRLTTAAVSVCLCMGPLLMPTLPGLPGGPVRATPPLCLAAAPRWSEFRLRCPVMPVDPFESVGARLWLLHVR